MNTNQRMNVDESSIGSVHEKAEQMEEILTDVETSKQCVGTFLECNNAEVLEPQDQSLFSVSLAFSSPPDTQVTASTSVRDRAEMMESKLTAAEELKQELGVMLQDEEEEREKETEGKVDRTPIGHVQDRADEMGSVISAIEGGKHFICDLLDSTETFAELETKSIGNVEQKADELEDKITHAEKRKQKVAGMLNEEKDRRKSIDSRPIGNVHDRAEELEDKLTTAEEVKQQVIGKIEQEIQERDKCIDRTPIGSIQERAEEIGERLVTAEAVKQELGELVEEQETERAMNIDATSIGHVPELAEEFTDLITTAEGMKQMIGGAIKDEFERRDRNIDRTPIGCVDEKAEKMGPAIAIAEETKMFVIDLIEKSIPSSVDRSSIGNVQQQTQRVRQMITDAEEMKQEMGVMIQEQEEEREKAIDCSSIGHVEDRAEEMGPAITLAEETKQFVGELMRDSPSPFNDKDSAPSEAAQSVTITNQPMDQGPRVGGQAQGAQLRKTRNKKNRRTRRELQQKKIVQEQVLAEATRRLEDNIACLGVEAQIQKQEVMEEVYDEAMSRLSESVHCLGVDTLIEKKEVQKEVYNEALERLEESCEAMGVKQPPAESVREEKAPVGLTKNIKHLEEERRKLAGLPTVSELTKQKREEDLKSPKTSDMNPTIKIEEANVSSLVQKVINEDIPKGMLNLVEKLEDQRRTLAGLPTVSQMESRDQSDGRQRQDSPIPSHAASRPGRGMVDSKISVGSKKAGMPTVTELESQTKEQVPAEQQPKKDQVRSEQPQKKEPTVTLGMKKTVTHLEDERRRLAGMPTVNELESQKKQLAPPQKNQDQLHASEQPQKKEDQLPVEQLPTTEAKRSGRPHKKDSKISLGLKKTVAQLEGERRRSAGMPGLNSTSDEEEFTPLLTSSSESLKQQQVGPLYSSKGRDQTKRVSLKEEGPKEEQKEEPSEEHLETQKDEMDLDRLEKIVTGPSLLDNYLGFLFSGVRSIVPTFNQSSANPTEEVTAAAKEIYQEAKELVKPIVKGAQQVGEAIESTAHTAKELIQAEAAVLSYSVEEMKESMKSQIETKDIVVETKRVVEEAEEKIVEPVVQQVEKSKPRDPKSRSFQATVSFLTQPQSPDLFGVYTGEA